jgi:hypothetical protein
MGIIVGLGSFYLGGFRNMEFSLGLLFLLYSPYNLTLNIVILGITLSSIFMLIFLKIKNRVLKIEHFRFE